MEINELEVNNPNPTPKDAADLFMTLVNDSVSSDDNPHIMMNGKEYTKFMLDNIGESPNVLYYAENLYKLNIKLFNQWYKDLKNLQNNKSLPQNESKVFTKEWWKESLQLDELEISPPLPSFKLNIPKEWNGKLIHDNKEKDTILDEFAKLNSNLFKYIDIEFIKGMLQGEGKHYDSVKYPILTTMLLCEGLQEVLFDKFQQDDRYINTSEHWTSFKNLIVKQFDKRIINFNDINQFFDTHKEINELQVSNPVADFTVLQKDDDLEIDAGDYIVTDISKDDGTGYTFTIKNTATDKVTSDVYSDYILSTGYWKSLTHIKVHNKKLYQYIDDFYKQLDELEIKNPGDNFKYLPYKEQINNEIKDQISNFLSSIQNEWSNNKTVFYVMIFDNEGMFNQYIKEQISKDEDYEVENPSTEDIIEYIKEHLDLSQHIAKIIWKFYWDELGIDDIKSKCYKRINDHIEDYNGYIDKHDIKNAVRYTLEDSQIYPDEIFDDNSDELMLYLRNMLLGSQSQKLDELEITRPLVTWDLRTKYIPNFNTDNIKVGDIIKVRYYEKHTHSHVHTEYKVSYIISDDMGGGEMKYFIREENRGYSEEQLRSFNVRNKPTNLQESQQIQTISLEEYNKLLIMAIQYCCKDLNIPIPKIKIINTPKYTQQNNSYGGYVPSENKLYIVIYERTLADSMRTACHETYHSYQNYNNILTQEAGKDGDKFENSANAYAGKIMRIFGKNHPEIFFMKCRS